MKQVLPIVNIIPRCSYLPWFAIFLEFSDVYSIVYGIVKKDLQSFIMKQQVFPFVNISSAMYLFSLVCYFSGIF